jgi:ABC-type sugar transport system ATPase subunit
MRAQLDGECVIKANAQFWEQMLSMRLDAMPAGEEFCVDAGHILGIVGLSGVWRGRIEVRLTAGLAARATADATGRDGRGN